MEKSWKIIGKREIPEGENWSRIISFKKWIELYSIKIAIDICYHSIAEEEAVSLWDLRMTYIVGRNSHEYIAAAAAKSLQSCPTLCDPIDGSPPGPAVPGILQARTLEWVAISSSNEWKWKVKVKLLSRVRLLATPWTAAYQAPPSMGFSRQEYWGGVPLPSPMNTLRTTNVLLPKILFLLLLYIICIHIQKPLINRMVLIWRELTNKSDALGYSVQY